MEGTGRVASRAAFAGRLGERGAQLLDRYGTRASDVQAFAATTQDLPLATLPGYSASEIAYICTSENVRRLADLLLRRTAITMEGLLTSEAIQETAVIAGKVLGWSKARIAEEISHAEHEMQKRSVSRARTAV